MTDIFDYVIVGAGSAGCVLANRLSADPTITVCLVEAGPTDTSPLIHVPLLGLPKLFGHERLNWRFMSTPQAGGGGRSIYMPRGKVLGGSSAINGMVYIRGHPGDYDDWRDAGNGGWSFAEVLPYFCRSENNAEWRNSPYHGTSGPLGVANVRARNPLTKQFLEAARSENILPCGDFNGQDGVGAGYRQITQSLGKRASSAAAFLAPVKNRKNLSIITDALADRVLFEGRRATAVRVLLGGEERAVHARREVILSAGAIGSPHILLRSGVGDAVQLQTRGVPLVHHLSGVGRNLHDHPTISIASETRSTEPYGISAKVLPRLAWNLIEYLLFRRGLLASNGFEVGAFVRSEPDLARPDVQLSLMTALQRISTGAGPPSLQFGYGHGYSLTAVVLRPQSRGSVALASRDPLAAPLIDPGFLQVGYDLDALLTGLKLVRRLLAKPAFDRYDSTELAPGRGVQDDDALRSYIRASGGLAFHPVGTCAMGQGAEAVVDAELRVHGVERLRVVDAAVMPTIPGGNTNAPTIMIAEKAADMILGRPPLAATEAVLFSK